MKQTKGHEREKRELIRMEKEMVLLKKKSKSLRKHEDLSNLIEESKVLNQILDLIKSMNEIRFNMNYGE